MDNRRIDNALRISQIKLKPLVQCRLQGLLGLMAAVLKHQRCKISSQSGGGGHHGVKTPQRQGLGAGVVLQQLVTQR